MKLTNLIARIEKKIRGKFAGKEAFCVHRPAIVRYPDGSLDGDNSGNCRIARCHKPQLRILVSYPGCEFEVQRRQTEARHFFDEMRFSKDKVLSDEQILEIACSEFGVSREDLS